MTLSVVFVKSGLRGLRSMGGLRSVFLLMVLGFALSAGRAIAVEPDHPIITEIYTDPVGLTDGPVGRDVTSLHQGFIEIYLPPATALNASLLPFRNAMRLSVYEVEGDSSSSGVALMNYRFDLPAFDLDPSDGVTALPRPPSGVVVLGWVDYFQNPPTGFAAPETALINGGITTPPTDFTFLAINGLQFGGTLTFSAVAGESLIDLPNEAVSGVIQNGSGAYLLVSRDLPGYAELCDDQHALDCVLGAGPQLRHPSPILPGGNILSPSAFLDGLAGNDDPLFRIDRQPFDAPTGDDIDLETVLPLGGTYSLLIPQIPEVVKSLPNAGVANGYARFFVDVAKTTENAFPGDDDPIIDAQFAYRHVRNNGPFFPSPGVAAGTTSPPQLEVAGDIEHVLDVLSGTVGFPGVLSANTGGDFGIDMSVDSVGLSSDPTVATFVPGPSDLNVRGQSFGFPGVAVTPSATAIDGETATATVSISAANSFPPPDPVVDPTPQVRTVTARILNPTTGLDANGLPFQATVFAAVQAVPNTVGANELLATDFGVFMSANLGVLVQDTKANGPVLSDPGFDLADGECIHAGCNCDIFGMNCDPPQLITDFPQISGEFINFVGPDGILATADDLLSVVTNSAEQQANGTYDGNILVSDIGSCAGNGIVCSILAQNCTDFTTCLSTFDGVRGIRFNVPDTFTFGGTFSPTEVVHFADATGRHNNPRSGLSNATTTRTFELAIVDTNVRQASTPAITNIESGATDDFGIIVEVLDVEPGPTPPVVTGDFVFLSFTGGLEGADIDGLAVGTSQNVANLIFLDLDNLHDQLGIISIESIIVMDTGGGTGGADIIEVFTLNPVTTPPAIAQWQSCSDHGAVGEACMTISDDGSFVEPRLCADTLVVTLDAPVNPATAIPQNVTVIGNDVTNSPVNLASTVVSVTTRAADTQLVITFAPALPDVARYSVTLSNLLGATGMPYAGDMDRIFSVVRGDTNQSLNVTNADLGFDRFFRDQPTNPVDPAQPFEVAADVNCSGAVTNADLGAVRFFRDIGSDARAILDP